MLKVNPSLLLPPALEPGIPGAGLLPRDLLLPLTTTCTGAVALPREVPGEREDPPTIRLNDWVSWEISLFNFFVAISSNNI